MTFFRVAQEAVEAKEEMLRPQLVEADGRVVSKAIMHRLLSRSFSYLGCLL